MRTGINLPHLGSSATKDAVVRGAEHAERLGYDSVWTLDRLLSPVRPRNPYPGTPDVVEWPSYFRKNLDPLDSLTFAAAHTSTIGLGTAVLDIPFYNPLLLARRLATLDVLSEGRVIAGFGLGYSEDEYEATGTTASVRGRRADEFLEVLKLAWTADLVAHEGEFFTVPESRIDLKPVQRPYPPIYLAAYAPAALRRAALYADGWLPAGLPFDDLAAWTTILRQQAADTGRDPSELKVVPVYLPHLTESPLGDDREPLTGTPAQVKDDVARLRDLGVHELVLELKLSHSTDALLDDMERFRELL